jgi:hypothetical protein
MVSHEFDLQIRAIGRGHTGQGRGRSRALFGSQLNVSNVNNGLVTSLLDICCMTVAAYQLPSSGNMATFIFIIVSHPS